jgi:hypothetical protein
MVFDTQLCIIYPAPKKGVSFLFLNISFDLCIGLMDETEWRRGGDGNVCIMHSFIPSEKKIKNLIALLSTRVTSGRR